MSAYNYERYREEIDETFRYLLKSLDVEQSKAVDAIEEWCAIRMDEIKEHTIQQRQLVYDAKETHQKHLENIRDQYLEINRICDQKNNTDEIRQLLEKCKSFKVNLVDLNFTPKSKDFIEVTIIEPPERLEHEESNLVTTEGDKLQSKLIERNTTGSVSDPDVKFTTSAVAAITSSNQDSTFGSSSKTTSTDLDRTK